MNTSRPNQNIPIAAKPVSLLRPHRLHAPLIISNGSRPAFGRTTPNPSISVQQTQAPAMGNMFPKMGKE